MPTRKRMLPMESRARSKKRMRPKRRKKTPIWGGYGYQQKPIAPWNMEGDV
jgi:hypothetical protein